MARQSAVFAVAGLLVGIAMTIVVTARNPDSSPDGLLMPLLLQYTPTVGCTAIGVMILRRWMDGHAALMRREIDAAAEERRTSAAALNTQAAELARREARVGAVLQSLVDERAAHDQLKLEHAELTADYNRVVVDCLQQSAAFFQPGAVPAEETDGVCIPMPTRSHRSGDVPRQLARDVAEQSRN